MISKSDRNRSRLKCYKRIRGKTSSTAERSRLSAFHSNENIRAQLTDDVEGVTLASASTNGKNTSTEGPKMEQAAEVGKALVETAVKKNVKSVVSDRSGYLYYGRVQALADAARENGSEF